MKESEGLKFSDFGGTLLLFESKVLTKAERLLARGSQIIKERELYLVR